MEPEVYVQMRRIEDRHWWFVSRRRIVDRMLEKFTQPAARRILDVGCGTGGNLPMLSKFGEVIGIEMSTAARSSAMGRGASQIYLGSFPEDLPEAARDFDLITFLDVLEHLDDDIGALQATQGLLAPSGKVLITVPAFNFLWSSHDAQHHHRRRYSADQLKKLLLQSGLEPLYVSYFNTWLFPVISALRIAKRLTGNHHSDDERMPSPMVNSLLKFIFSSERHLLGRLSLPFGVSIMAIARKAPSTPEPLLTEKPDPALCDPSA